MWSKDYPSVVVPLLTDVVVVGVLVPPTIVPCVPLLTGVVRTMQVCLCA